MSRDWGRSAYSGCSSDRLTVPTGAAASARFGSELAGSGRWAQISSRASGLVSNPCSTEPRSNEPGEIMVRLARTHERSDGLTDEFAGRIYG
jgi:hypothetical protein